MLTLSGAKGFRFASTLSPFPLKKILLLFVWIGAEPSYAQEAQWMERMFQACMNTSYTGTAVIHNNNTQKVVKVSRGFDANGASVEVIKFQDPSSKEILLREGVTTWVIPNKKIVVYSKSDRTILPNFPRTLADLNMIQNNYVLTLGPVRQLAQRTAQILIASPKDAYRYPHQFWLDSETAFPLGIFTSLNNNDTPRDTFAFTEIELASKIKLPAMSNVPPPSWRTIEFKHSDIEEGLSTPPLVTPWVVTPPPNYRLIHAYWITRKNSDEEKSTLPFAQYIYSDGLATASLFIRLAQKGQHATAHKDDVYERFSNGYQIVALGDVPFITLELLGNSVQWKQ